MASLANGYPFTILKKVKEGQSNDFPSYLFQFWGNPQAPSASLFDGRSAFIFSKPLAKLIEKMLQE
ncbi:hypothetical protein CECT5772_07449 [Streptococcus equi subsp. ruminatorum CECT 5772]|uniref:Uncharacterized protein n=1 Tax=Streptococcus equi subsp. ruminatorum CECT 5772 TaxID=1051981 RepID=A0A922SZL0_9STRE|nr:hypothetical protein CECT5772_07449 [Streptococcus equi subsp. ruminatorum CECT 5772]